MGKDLSVLIPSRNEMFLRQTIEDVLLHSEADTEVIAVVDGDWPDPPIPDDPRVTLVRHAKPKGQRQNVNLAARMSKAKYIMKLDAHCALDQGFDRKLIEAYQEGQTVIPRMYNLHAFDWVCCERLYQGRQERCPKCGGEMKMEIVWKPRLHRKTDYARFDKTLHFQYWYKHEPKDNDVMCFVGACFFLSRERYWELDGMDEGHGSWGQMGVEVSLKSWLSGGSVVVNKDTWFSHLFRPYGFPYKISFEEQERARQYSRELWRLDSPHTLPKWNKAIRPLQWVIDKFNPPEW